MNFRNFVYNIWIPILKDIDLIRFSETYFSIFLQREILCPLYILRERIWYIKFSINVYDKNTFFLLFHLKTRLFLNELRNFSDSTEKDSGSFISLAHFLLSPVVSTFLKWQTRVVNQFSALFFELSITQWYYFASPYN